MSELAAIYDLVGRAGSYATLDFSTDTTDPARGALLARVEERSTALATAAAVLRARVGGALRRSASTSCSRYDGLDFCRHHLRTARRYRPHLLSEPEERILTEKSISGPQRVGAAVRAS